jgi:hypothetical protein
VRERIDAARRLLEEAQRRAGGASAAARLVRPRSPINPRPGRRSSTRARGR